MAAGKFDLRILYLAYGPNKSKWEKVWNIDKPKEMGSKKIFVCVEQRGRVHWPAHFDSPGGSFQLPLPQFLTN